MTIEQIAAQLHISKSTVSKALNNCPGVSVETKSRIMELAEELGYHTVRKGTIGMIMPATPVRYYKSLMQVFGDQYVKERISAYSCVYSAIDFSGENDPEVVRCIMDAVRNGASVLVVISQDTENIRNALRRYTDTHLVLSVQEKIDMKNVFYIGEDSFTVGYDLGKQFISAHPDDASIVAVEYIGSTNARGRMQGFAQALSEFGIKHIPRIQISVSGSAFPSILARELARQKSLFNCVFTSANNALQVCSTIQKLKTGRTIHCVGFENAPTARMDAYNEILKGIAFQNTQDQVSQAVRVINQYLQTGTFPEEKCLYTKLPILISE